MHLDPVLLEGKSDAELVAMIRPGNLSDLEERLRCPECASRKPENVGREEPRIQVSTSELDGYGVFAAEDIPAGTVLREDLGEPTIVDVGDPHWQSGTAVKNKHGEGVATWGDKVSWGNYLNHDDDANLTLDDTYRPVVLRDVEAGEELVIDYREHLHPDHGAYNDIMGPRREDALRWLLRQVLNYNKDALLSMPKDALGCVEAFERGEDITALVQAVLESEE